jgi:hypothetical protein
VHRFLLFLQLCVVKFGCQGVFLKQVFSWIIWESLITIGLKIKRLLDWLITKPVAAPCKLFLSSFSKSIFYSLINFSENQWSSLWLVWFRHLD